MRRYRSWVVWLSCQSSGRSDTGRAMIQNAARTLTFGNGKGSRLA
jgi:hypothetical protein